MTSSSMGFEPRIVQPGHTNCHSAQLFDTLESRSEAVASFVRAGLLRGDVVLLVVTEEHWDAIVRRLHAAQVPVAATQASGQLIVRDAYGTLRLFRRGGVIDGQLFERTVGSLVRRLQSAGNRLQIYGEAVDLLAAEEDFRAAIQLEELWNALARRASFSIFCGYSSEHFGQVSDGEALTRICGAHTHVRVHPRDPLGSFLVNLHVEDPSRPTQTKH